MRIVWNAIRLSSDANKTHLVFDIDDDLFRIGAFSETFSRIMSDPAGAAIVRERKYLDLSQALQWGHLPEGSVGRVYCDFLKANNLDPEFFRSVPQKDDFSFLVQRLRQTHDLWHVVTGFGTDVRGEVGLQAFTMSMLAIPLSMIIVGAALIRIALSNPAETPFLLDHISRGVILGNRTRGLFAFDWENNWSTPLEQVQRQLKLDVSYSELAPLLKNAQ